jgi:hypothetical protein
VRADDADAPEWWQRAGRLSRLPLIALLVLGVILFRALDTGGPAAPPLAKSCTTAAFALSAAQLKQHQVVRYSVTGRPGSTLELTVGVAGFAVTGSRLEPRAEAGHGPHAMQAASPQLRLGSSCRASGQFGVIVPPGRYGVRLYSLSGPRSAPVATVVAEQPVTVSASGR